MSPITHALTGWVLAQPLADRKQRMVVTAAAVISDLDGVSLLFGVEAYQKWHHTFGHNLFFGLLLSALAAIYFRSVKVTTLVFISYHSHLFCDLLGSGTDWGIPYFWPVHFHVTMFAPPFQWELDSWQNVAWTAICLSLTLYFGITKKRTPVELVSPRTDMKVCATLAHRFSKAA